MRSLQSLFRRSRLPEAKHFPSFLKDGDGKTWDVVSAEVFPDGTMRVMLKPCQVQPAGKPESLIPAGLFSALASPSASCRLSLTTAAPGSLACHGCGMDGVNLAGGLCPACAAVRTTIPVPPSPACSVCHLQAKLGPQGLCAPCDDKRLAAKRCPKCGKSMPGSGSSRLCRQCGKPALPVEHRTDLIPGTKYARLYLDGDGKPCFRGHGYANKPFYTESYAECAQGKNHQAPDSDCQCGFWVLVRKESALARWDCAEVALEVEIAGMVLDCAGDGTPVYAPAWGYRAQWQRVLSVTLSQQCAMATSSFWAPGYWCYHPSNPNGWAKGRAPCTAPPQYLCAVAVGAYGSQLLSACKVHVTPSSAIRRPVSFLREFLQTEVRAGQITDEATLVLPPPVRTGDDLTRLEYDYYEAVNKTTARIVPTSVIAAAMPPGIAPGGRAVVEINGNRYTARSTGSGTVWVDRIDSDETDAIEDRKRDLIEQVRAGKIPRDAAVRLPFMRDVRFG